jgi:hypothetical protein
MGGLKVHSWAFADHDVFKGPPGETKRIQTICSFYVLRTQFVTHANFAELLGIPDTESWRLTKDCQFHVMLENRKEHYLLTHSMDQSP